MAGIGDRISFRKTQEHVITKEEFAEVKVKDAPLLRSEMRSYLGSKGQYYRYKLGQQKLLPEQQEHIKQLFARFGYKDVDFDYFAEEIDFTSI